MDQTADDIDVGVAVRDHHALRSRRCTAAVVDGEEIVFGDVVGLESTGAVGDRRLASCRRSPAVSIHERRDQTPTRGFALNSRDAGSESMPLQPAIQKRKAILRPGRLKVAPRCPGSEDIARPLGGTTDIVPLAVFLASKESAWIAGEVIRTAGGLVVAELVRAWSDGDGVTPECWSYRRGCDRPACGGRLHPMECS